VGVAVFGRCNAALCDALQVGAGTERATFPPEDGHVRRVIGVEGDKHSVQFVGTLRVDGIADFRTR